GASLTWPAMSTPCVCLANTETADDAMVDCVDHVFHVVGCPPPSVLPSPIDGCPLPVPPSASPLISGRLSISVACRACTPALGDGSAGDDVEPLDPLTFKCEPVVQVCLPAREVALEVVADHPGLAVAIDLGDLAGVLELGSRLAYEAAEGLF